MFMHDRLSIVDYAEILFSKQATVCIYIQIQFVLKNCMQTNYILSKIKIHAHTFIHFSMAFVCPFECTVFILILFKFSGVQARARQLTHVCTRVVCVFRYHRNDVFFLCDPMLWNEISAKYWPYTHFAHGFHASIFGSSNNATLFYIRNMN